MLCCLRFVAHFQLINLFQSVLIQHDPLSFNVLLPPFQYSEQIQGFQIFRRLLFQESTVRTCTFLFLLFLFSFHVLCAYSSNQSVHCCHMSGLNYINAITLVLSSASRPMLETEIKTCLLNNMAGVVNEHAFDHAMRTALRRGPFRCSRKMCGTLWFLQERTKSKIQEKTESTTGQQTL